MGHRINPTGLRLNLGTSWNSVAPSKSIFIKDFFFNYFFGLELYTFLIESRRRDKYSEQRFLAHIIRKLEYKVFIQKRNLYFKKVEDLKLKKNTVIYKLVYLKNFKKKKVKRHLRLINDNEFFYLIHDIFSNLHRTKFQIEYCRFQKIMGNLTLKIYCKLEYFESEFFNYIRFSQKWMKLKFFKLSLFSNEIEEENLKNLFPELSSKAPSALVLLYKTLYLYDFAVKKNYITINQYTLTQSFYQLYSIFLNISKLFLTSYLNNFNFFFNFMRKSLIGDLAKKSQYNLINIEFAYSNTYSIDFLTKHIKYRMKGFKSIGKIIYSFLKILRKVFRKTKRLQRRLYQCHFDLRFWKSEFFELDTYTNFNNYFDLLGLSLKSSGRFSRKRRVRSQTYSLSHIPLNSFHKNIQLNLAEVRLKFGVGAVKLWTLKTPNIKYTY